MVEKEDGIPEATPYKYLFEGANIVLVKEEVLCQSSNILLMGSK